MQIFMSLVFAALICLVIYFISLPFQDNVKKNKKALEQAIRDGHVVNAVRYKVRSHTVAQPGTFNFGGTLGYYKYEYEGKTYQYKYQVGPAQTPPAVLKLYFVSNPRKATVREALTGAAICWPLVYIILAAAIYFVGFGS